MKRNKLPLDPFDPRTPLSMDYQIGSLALGVAPMGGAIGIYLLATANYAATSGWLRVFGGLIVMCGAGWLARRLWRML